MKKPVAFAASIVVAAIVLMGGCTPWRRARLEDVAPAPVSEFQAPEHARKAYAVLRDTGTFSSANVGYGGGPSTQVVAFQVLLTSRQADRGFKLLLQKATIEGQLYGLCGIYFTDHAAFRQALGKYRNSNQSVQTEFGCVVESRPVSSVVFAKGGVDPVALKSWHRDNPLAEYPPVDIAHGGWPIEFRDAYRRK